MTNASRWKDANVKAGGKVAAAMHLGIAAAKDRISREAAAELVRFAHERFPEVAINGDVASARLDALVAIGEDRFLLDTLHRADARVPVLAVGAGFLAELPVQGLQDAIPKLVAGKHRVEERLRLAVTAGDVSAPPALNEAVLTTSRGGGFLRYSLQVDGERVWRDAGDGVIISTPTGSTAYALSAGGPIVMETSESLVVVPICSNEGRRPFVVPRRSVIAISEIESRHGREIVIDGRQRVRVGASGVTVKASDRPARFVRFEKARYMPVFGKLEAKGREEALPGRAPPSAKFVYRVLRDQGALTEKQLVHETGLPERTLRSALAFLARSHLVRRLGSLRDAREAVFALER